MTRNAKIGVTTGISVGVTAFCLLLTWLPGRLFGQREVGFLASELLFPFWHIGLSLHAGQRAAEFPSSFWLVCLQFPVYGLFVCLAWLRNRLRGSLVAITVIHSLAVIAAFAAYIYVAR